MITEKEVKEGGYTILPRGGWIYVDPEIVPRDWDDLAKNFGFDPDCEGVYLCIAGFKERILEVEYE
jgi:hypothetical protein